jgi:protein-L-isoaspartate(D-aspartate) O-methyltransferase
MIGVMASEPLRTALVTQLISDGVLRDPRWIDAFTAVRRELFVPYYFDTARGRPGWCLIDEADGQKWLRGVYTDDALVTQLNGTDDAVQAAGRDEALEGVPTSSSSAPRLMAAMLEALTIADGMTTLEIGTGSGYQAALLAHRLGSAYVSTIEVDAELSARAASALCRAGYEPTVVVGDGASGYPANAPCDRVIATVALPQVPSALLRQMNPGALMLLPLTFSRGGGLMALLRQETPDRACGRMLGQYGGFMPVRASPEPPRAVIRDLSPGQGQLTSIPPAALTTERDPSTFFLSLRCPTRFSTIGFTPADGSTGPQIWGRGADGSVFAVVHTDRGSVVYADGPLWNKLEDAHREWLELGKPARERFGVTVDGARQWVWLDTEEHVIAPLPDTRDLSN